MARTKEHLQTEFAHPETSSLECSKRQAELEQRLAAEKACSNRRHRPTLLGRHYEGHSTTQEEIENVIEAYPMESN